MRMRIRDIKDGLNFIKTDLQEPRAPGLKRVPSSKIAGKVPLLCN